MADAQKPRGVGLKDFFYSLLPNFEKRNLLESVNALMKEMAVVPDMYIGDEATYKKVLAGEFRSVENAISTNCKKYKGKFTQFVGTAFADRMAEQDKLIDYINDLYGPVVLRDALDYEKIQLLRYLDILTFTAKYARKLILAMTNSVIGESALMSPIDKQVASWLLESDNIKTFATGMCLMETPIKDIRAAFSKMEKVHFDAENESMVGNQVGFNKADPMQMGFVPGVGHLTVLVGRTYNLYVAKRHEESQEERDKLKVQLLILQRKAEASQDPGERARLEKQLAYYNNRLNKIEAQLSEMEQG